MTIDPYRLAAAAHREELMRELLKGDKMTTEERLNRLERAVFAALDEHGRTP